MDPVSVTWLLFDKSRIPFVHGIKIPYKLFTGAAQDCQELFAAALQKRYKFKADTDSVTFWKPREPLLISTIDDMSPMWPEKFANVEDVAMIIFGPCELSDYLQVDDKELVHVFVTADIDANVEANEVRDIVGALPEFQRYFNVVRAKKLYSPSDGAEYAAIQRDPDLVIYDGRYTPPVQPTVAPPLPIFHPIFELFIRLLGDKNFQPTLQDITKTHEVMGRASVIVPTEAVRYYRTISELLKAIIHVVNNDEEHELACMHPLIMELKRELGESDWDPSVQAGLRMSAFWHGRNMETIRKRCCCPTLMLAGGGPWLAVLGGVFTDKCIVQRLTDMIWIGHTSTHQETRVMQLARVFAALRECTRKLKNFYKHIIDHKSELPEINIKVVQPHPRLYPYPTSFMENGQTVEFEYVRALVDHPSCVTFQAKTQSDNPEDIVIKFIAEYSKEVHVFLAELGHAPRLRFYGPLPNKWSILSDSQAKATEDVMDRRLLPVMKMVVMDYIEEGEEPKTSVARQQVSNVLAKLHDGGFVLGDLRRDNILFDKTGKPQLIDFDWAGRYRRDDEGHAIPDDMIHEDYAHYPLGLTSTIDWHAGAKDFLPILPEHDTHMLNVMYPG
ncbi:hypothetical protein AX17_002218 [Amanita inopinata Kibby_2008]|nr:hypothetical protein AX17_002218 [Amanita inopinata Kibby_2008]